MSAMNSNPEVIELSVPATALYARSVRMLASSLATAAGMSVDKVSDVRMATEEAFVYALATKPEGDLYFRFFVEPGCLGVNVELGEDMPDLEDPESQAAYAFLVISAVCSEHKVTTTNVNTLLMTLNA